MGDAAETTFGSFPVMITIMMCMVLLLLGSTVCSLVAPLRAVICLLWMLGITLGMAIFIYQDGLLGFLNWQPLGKRSTGAMSWFTPSITIPVLVGLGLDYDIFYSERVLEECERGYSEAEASRRALHATANTISAAGLIMVIAFSSLLLSAVPLLNEIALMLTIGILLDCFVTTKIVIPCVMALFGRFSFWPRKFQR